MQTLVVTYHLGFWIANDGMSICDGDPDLAPLVSRLESAGWRYVWPDGSRYVFVRCE